MKISSPTNVLIVKELQGKVKLSSSVRIIKQFGIVDGMARNFTGTFTKVFSKQLNIYKRRNVREWNVGIDMYLPVIYTPKQHVTVAKLVSKK